MEWMEPVTDRTEQDILDQTAKGYCNAGDLNRLENNCALLAGLLGVELATRSWTRADFPTQSELSRIRGNIARLREAYYTRPTAPDTPENPLNHWGKWNAAEAILKELYELYGRNEAAFLRAGEGYAGDGIGVI